MKLISYNDLANLRFKDFLSPTDETYVEESGIIVCVGLGGYEELGQYGENHFGWRQGEPHKTAEVGLDLRPESKLPIETARRIIKILGLPIGKGMTIDQLIQLFGNPETNNSGPTGAFLRFVCGVENQYLLGCSIDNQKGLESFFLARKDYVDDHEAI